MATLKQVVRGNEFWLQFITPNQKDGRRASSGNNFVSKEGAATNNCNEASIYTLSNGTLLSNTSSGTLQFGTDPGKAYSNFTPSANPGSIVTTFGIDNENHLFWSNPAFPDNAVSFCVLSDNTIVSVFQTSAGPPACLYIPLTITQLTNCGLNPGVIHGGGPGPTGPIDKSHGY